MLSKKMADALNRQINAELYSSYLYLSMAGWFESGNLRGFAQWMRVQAAEEHGHAMKFFEFLVERQAKPKMATIAAPPETWKAPLAAFQDVLKHEKKVTGMIDALADQAEKENDRATAIMLQWFISEQVEEEANATEIVGKLEMIGDSVGGLLQLDHHLGKRGAGAEKEGA